MSKEQHAAVPSADSDQGDSPAPTPPVAPSRGQPRTTSVVTWTRRGAGQSAIIDGREYRVTKFPPDAAVSAPYGAYAEERFIGSGNTLDNVKGRCAAHARKLRFRKPEPMPDDESDPTA